MSGRPNCCSRRWQNDREQFTLELAHDGTYASAYAESAASGSVRKRETGHWTADGTKLTLRPESAGLSSIGRYNLHRDTGKEDIGRPRTYAVAALVLEYTRNNLVYRVDGIELKGPRPPWYYTPSGNFAIVLRRTRQPSAK